MNAKVSKNRGKIRKEQYVFKLYISGIRPAGERAYSNLKLLCEEYLKGHYKISIVNIRQEPRYIIKEQLLTAPTVIKKYPLPEVRMAGDLSDIDKY